MYEQEADRVADQVMRMREVKVQRQVGGEKLIQTKTLTDQITPLIQRQVEEEEEELFQTKRYTGKTPEVGSDLEARIHALRSGGQPLPDETRTFMGSMLGADFSEVRVHADVESNRMNRSLNARAFTMGQNIFFSQGAYNPGSKQGQELIAHELTHVVQQSGDQDVQVLKERSMETPTIQRWGIEPRTIVSEPEEEVEERYVRYEIVPREHPDYRPEGEEAQFFGKHPCFAGRNCTGRRYNKKYTHCHNCRRAGGRSLLKPTGCENC